MSGVAVRFDCPDCGPTLAQGFRVVGTGLLLRCARCGRLQAAAPTLLAGDVPPTGRVPSASPPAPASPPAAPSALPPASPHAAPGEFPPAASRTQPLRAADAHPASAQRAHPLQPAQAGAGLELLQGGGHGTSAAASAPDARAALLLPAIPPGVCPSCLRERAAMDASCAGCGLDFLKADPSAFAPSAQLSRAWADLTTRWEEPAAHARFLSGARAADALRDAARLYRLHLLAAPGDPQAQGALEKLVAESLAMAAVSRSETSDPEALQGRRRQRLMLAALLLSLLLAGLAMMM